MLALLVLRRLSLSLLLGLCVLFAKETCHREIWVYGAVEVVKKWDSENKNLSQGDNQGPVLDQDREFALNDLHLPAGSAAFREGTSRR